MNLIRLCSRDGMKWIGRFCLLLAPLVSDCDQRRTFPRDAFDAFRLLGDGDRMNDFWLLVDAVSANDELPCFAESLKRSIALRLLLIASRSVSLQHDTDDVMMIGISLSSWF